MNNDLRRQLLRMFNDAATPAERKGVLDAIDSARHEIRRARLEQEPAMRALVWELENKLAAIVSGAPAHKSMAETSATLGAEFGSDDHDIATSGIVEIAAKIEVQLAMRGAHTQAMQRELRGGYHANRVQSAAEAERSERVSAIIVTGGASGRSSAPDPSKVKCIICKADPGAPCSDGWRAPK